MKKNLEAFIEGIKSSLPKSVGEVGVKFVNIGDRGTCIYMGEMERRSFNFFGYNIPLPKFLSKMYAFLGIKPTNQGVEYEIESGFDGIFPIVVNQLNAHGIKGYRMESDRINGILNSINYLYS